MEAKESRPVFDISKPIGITLKHPDGDKRVEVRFPTDEEWIERQSRHLIVARQFGDGSSNTSVKGVEEADLELLEKIRVPSSTEIDGFEASYILNRLGRAEATEITPEGALYCISLRVPGGVTSIVLQVPTIKEVRQYQRALFISKDMKRGRSETVINLAAAGELFKKLCKRTEGYAGVPPIVHQSVAVGAIVSEMESLQSESDSGF